MFIKAKTKELIRKLKLKTGTRFIGHINNHMFEITDVFNETYGTESGRIRTKKQKTAKIHDITIGKTFTIGLDTLAHCAISVI